MLEESPCSLEAALVQAQSDAEAALKVAAIAVATLKKFRAAAQTGHLRELRKMAEAAKAAVADLSGQILRVQDGLQFNEEAYFSSGAFPREVLKAAQERGVRMFEQDDRLYCYPFLIRVAASERAVFIDKARERKLRPSVLVEHLKALQLKPVRFKSDAFLSSLATAYDTAIKVRGRSEGAVAPLVEIYDLLTLLPGQSKEYPRPEFARDLYLLDQSGVTADRGGRVIGLHPARGTESASRIFSIVTKEGEMKKYYALSFTASSAASSNSCVSHDQQVFR